MKNRFIALLLSTALILTSCGSNTSADTSQSTSNEVETEVTAPVEPTTTETEESTEESTENSEDSSALDTVEVDEGLFNVELIIPKDFVGETTQEELDSTVSEKGYKSATLNEDGSVTYIMTKQQHRDLLTELSDNINNTLSEMVGSEDYPNITEITANDDFTSFTVTTKSLEPDLSESFAAIAFFMYGGMYNVFAGTTIDNVHVDYINADTGEIISSMDSKDSE